MKRPFGGAHREKNRKRDFRKLWMGGINAAARINGLSYSRFISGLKNSGLDQPQDAGSIWQLTTLAFSRLVDVDKQGLGN